MRGGKRTGAGRKKGYSALEAEKAREYFVERVGACLKPIVEALVKRAEQGDIRAAQVLFERAYGRVPTAELETLQQIVNTQRKEQMEEDAQALKNLLAGMRGTG